MYHLSTYDPSPVQIPSNWMLVTTNILVCGLQVDAAFLTSRSTSAVVVDRMKAYFDFRCFEYVRATRLYLLEFARLYFDGSYVRIWSHLNHAGAAAFS